MRNMMVCVLAGVLLPEHCIKKNSIMNPSTLTVRLDTLDLVDLCTLVMPILPHFQWEFF